MNAILLSLSIVDSTFENNTSVIGGAVINVETNGAIEMRNSTFKKNKS